MKKLLALVVCLGLATYANAALLSDDFNDGSYTDTWTVLHDDLTGGGYAAMTIVDQGGGDYALYKPDYDGDTWNAYSTFAAQSSGTIVLEVTTQSNGAWRPLNFGLTDASGNGLWLNAYMGDGYIEFGVSTTSDYAYSEGTSLVGGSDLACDQASEQVLRWTINLDTGDYTGEVVGGPSQSGNVAAGLPASISAVCINSKKRVYIDDVVVTPEPATLALLGTGALGLLIRRKK